MALPSWVGLALTYFSALSGHSRAPRWTKIVSPRERVSMSVLYSAF